MTPPLVNGESDTALQDWIEAHLPLISPRYDLLERIAKEAWIAATKDTLSFVAIELNKKANHCTTGAEAMLIRNLADLIMRMKP